MSVENPIESKSSTSTSWSSVEIDSSVRVLDKSILSTWSSGKGVGVIRASRPIPDNGMGYYFEITILNCPDDPCYIDMGITSQKLQFQEISARAKNNNSGFRHTFNSFGYSSTGDMYWPNGEKRNKMQEYKGGDTIGCYFDIKRELCCFFLNGNLQNKILQVKNTNESFIPTLVFYNKGIVVDSLFVGKNWILDAQGTISNLVFYFLDLIQYLNCIIN